MDQIIHMTFTDESHARFRYQKEVQGLSRNWPIWHGKRQQCIDVGNFDEADKILAIINFALTRYERLVDIVKEQYGDDFEEKYFDDALIVKDPPYESGIYIDSTTQKEVSFHEGMKLLQKR